MDAVNWTNFAYYLIMGVLCVILWRQGWRVPAIILGTLCLHGIAFNIVYIYRDAVWDTCPPVCGLQNWSSVLRTHSLLAILTAMVDRILLVPTDGR